MSSLAGLAATAAMCGVIPGPTPSPAGGGEGNLLALHPHREAGGDGRRLRPSTAQLAGDIVLEPFLGSGTTLIDRRAHRPAVLRAGASIRLMSTTTIRRWQAADRWPAPAMLRATASFDDLAREAEATNAALKGRAITRWATAKPPLHTRFQKGKSGNPKGRPRGKKNMSTLLSTALNASIVVVANGRRKRSPSARRSSPNW